MNANARQETMGYWGISRRRLSHSASQSVFICPSTLLRAVSLSNGVHLWLQFRRLP
jgi:hypothetical protein